MVVPGGLPNVNPGLMNTLACLYFHEYFEVQDPRTRDLSSDSRTIASKRINHEQSSRPRQIGSNGKSRRKCNIWRKCYSSWQCEWVP